ncbi:phosphotransferase [Micrococcus terreus]|uniref:macrolide 2'-phosphotransferase n=1 Tax=Micrococcus terreus TaxID=574650 RepID=UPI0021A45390|nr:phosphotransferase [Micrococcus terreus]MCT2090008.1 phosphotransferase [Micrococcus terreus]
MNRTPMELAALASAAIPGLSPTGVAGSPDDPRDFDAAVVLDQEGGHWRVRSPRNQEAAMRLETELQVLSGFTPRVRAGLPFRVPSVAGAVRLEGLRTFVYHDLPGRELDLEELTGLGEHIVADIGRVIAAIHALPAAVVENADLPSYTAEQFRQRRLNELDQAATTGRIPPVLLRRWENALEEKELWDFTPVVVHGDLHEDNLLVHRGRLVAVTGWTDLHVGDPADDFAWLASAGDQDFAESVLAEYSGHLTGEGGSGTAPEIPGRSGAGLPDDDIPADPFGSPAPVIPRSGPDEHLLRRAALAAEFALAQWLVRGINAGDEGMASEAQEMLRELQLDVDQHGGQEISLSEPVPLPADAPLAHAGEDVSADVESEPEDLEDADEDDDLEDGAVITDADARTGSHAAGEAPRASTDGPAESAAQTAEREEAERSASQAALARLRQRRTD